jgi:hypothetical protein
MKEKLQHYKTRLLLVFIWAFYFVSTNAQTLTHSYTFEPGTYSGTTLYDQASTGQVNGTINGNDWEIKNGYFQNHNSYSTSGSTMGGYISFNGASLALNTYSAITLETYMTITNDLKNPNRWGESLYFGGTNGATSLMLQLDCNGTTSRAGVNDNKYAGYTTLTSNTTHHFVVVLVPSTASVAGYIAFYDNGSLVQSTALAANSFNTAVSAISTTNAFLGKGGWANPLSPYIFHEFNIYNGAMDAATVQARFKARNTKLATLTINTGTLAPAFDANINNYGVVIPVGTTSMNVAATTVTTTKAVAGAGTYDVSGDYGTITVKADSVGAVPYLINWRKAVSTPTMTHSYRFNGTANDAIGTDNGTVNGSGTISGGVYTTTAQTNLTSGTSQYISLPASSIGINNYPVVTMEAIGKINVTSTNPFFAYFGNNTLAGQSGGGTGNGIDYLYLHTKELVASSNINVNPWSGSSTYSAVTNLNDNKVHHVVGIMTMDSLILFQDGVLKGSVLLSTTNRLFNISSNKAYLFRSGYPNDLNSIGSLGEFNIWKGRLATSTVATRSTAFLKDATLSAITLSVGTISFDPNVTTYSINIPLNTTSVTVGATASKDFATMTGTGAITCNPGGATNVLVTSADGTTTKTYTLNFIPPTPVIAVVQSALSFDELNNTGTLTVTGANLSDVISFSGPSNYSFNPTTLPANSTSASVTVTYDGLAASSGNITLSSTGATSQTVSVSGIRNTDCFAPLHATGNLISDPYLNSLTAYSLSWGVGTGAVINTDISKVYCGLKSGKVTGQRAGGILYPLYGKWAINSGYRVRAKILVESGIFQVNVAGGPSVTAPTFTTSASWQTTDFKFATGATLNATASNQFLYFDDYASNAAGTGYVDNLEMYNIPLISATAGTGGAVSGAGPFDVGESVSLVATPSSGYHFVNWTVLAVEVSQSATYTFSASVNKTLVANFAANAVTVSSDANASTLINCATCDVTVANGATLTINETKALNSLTIAGGGKVTNNSGSTFTVANFTINSDAVNGTGTYVDGGTTNISGTINVQQSLSSIRNWYMSSPLTNAVAPAGYTYYQYNEPGDNLNPTGLATAYWKTVNTGDTFEKGRGYIALPASVVTPFTFTTSTGSLTTGDVPVNLTRTTGKTKEGFNLIGNPYPSYVNIDGFASGDIEPSYWYRTRNQAGNGWTFDTYNIPSTLGTGLSGLAVSANIPPMQAFWVRVKNTKSAATLTFTNAMRGHQDNANNKFRAPLAVKQQVLRLQVSNGTQNDEAIVYFNANASDGYDMYDSPKMSNASASIPEIYTTVDNEQLVINGLSNMTSDKAFPLGFTTGTSNTFSLETTEFSNFDTDTHVILRDNLQNKEQDITDGTPYVFSSDISATTTRFSIIFKSTGATTANTTLNEDDPTIVIYKNANNQIVIHCPENSSSDAFANVYNSLGQKLQTKQITGSITVVDTTFTPGVYVVTVSNAGKISTQKVILY